MTTFTYVRVCMRVCQSYNIILMNSGKAMMDLLPMGAAATASSVKAR